MFLEFFFICEESDCNLVSPCMSVKLLGRSRWTVLILEWFLQPPTGNGILTENSGVSGLISRADVASLVSDNVAFVFCSQLKLL